MQEHARVTEELRQASLAYKQLEADFQRTSSEFTGMKRQVQALAAENQILKKELAKTRSPPPRYKQP